MKRALGRRMQFSTREPAGEAPVSPPRLLTQEADGRQRGRPETPSGPVVTIPAQQVMAGTASAGLCFEDLMFSEKFLLWSARFWWTLVRNGQESLTPLADAFRVSKLGAALGPFDAVMTVLATQARAPVKIKHVRSQTLSQDERRLLFLITARPGAIRDAVSAHLLPCRGTTLMRPLLAQLDETLSDAGMFLPRRVWDFSRSPDVPRRRHVRRPISGACI